MPESIRRKTNGFDMVASGSTLKSRGICTYWPRGISFASPAPSRGWLHQPKGGNCSRSHNSQRTHHLACKRNRIKNFDSFKVSLSFMSRKHKLLVFIGGWLFRRRRKCNGIMAKRVDWKCSDVRKEMITFYYSFQINNIIEWFHNRNLATYLSI